MDARRLAWWLFFIIGLVLLFHPLFARYGHAAPVFRAQSASSGPVALKLLQDPCKNSAVIAYLTKLGAGPNLRKFKAAVLTYGGRDWASCWIEFDGYVYSVDEEGSPLEPIPRKQFKEEGV